MLILPESTVFSYHKSDSFLWDHTCYEGFCNFTVHTHDFLELIFLINGDISYSIEGKIYSTPTNSLIISHPGQNHTIIFNAGNIYNRYAILIDERILAPNIYNLVSQESSVISFDDNPHISDIFKKIEYYCTNADADIFQYLVPHLVEEILYNVVITSLKASKNKLYTANKTVTSIVSYIDRNISSPLNLDIICKEFFITKNYLHKLFVKHIGVSPKKYITHKKLHLAQKKLQKGSKPTDVYISFGFTDYSTFYRDYVNYFGHAPSEEIFSTPNYESISTNSIL